MERIIYWEGPAVVKEAKLKTDCPLFDQRHSRANRDLDYSYEDISDYDSISLSEVSSKLTQGKRLFRHYVFLYKILK